MGKYINILLVLFFALTSCEEWPIQPDHRIKEIRGKWRIIQISGTFQNGRDTLATSDLGYLVFGSCSERDNRSIALGCNTGQRIYASGQLEGFHFQTLREEKDIQRLNIATKYYEDKGDDLMGFFFINKVTFSELIISCQTCSVGRNHAGVFKNFELRAIRE